MLQNKDIFSYQHLQLDTNNVYLLQYEKYPIENYTHLLNIEEQQRFDSFLSVKRRYEFLSTRILKEYLFPKKQIFYTEQGRPHIEGQQHISISHCWKTCAIAVSQHYDLGLDIEPISDKAQRLHSKFLNENELRLLDINDPLLMTRAWSCKETLLKLSGRKGLVFKRDLIIEDYNGSETFFCTIKLASKQSVSVSLTSKLLKDMILTINTSSVIPSKV